MKWWTAWLVLALLALGCGSPNTGPTNTSKPPRTGPNLDLEAPEPPAPPPAR